VRTLRHVLAGVFLGLTTAFLVPSPAQAHAVALRSDPPANTVVPTAPPAVTVTFSESIQPVAGRIRILGPDNKRADADSATVRGAVLTIPLKPGATKGTYLVSYRVLSADSHPVGGSFAFSIEAASTTTPTEEGGEDRVNRTVAISMGVAKYLGYAGLVLVIGPALVLAMLWPARLSRRDPALLARAGLGLLAVGTLLEMYLQAPYSTGGGLFDVSGTDLAAVLDSRYGAMHLVRLGVIAAAAVLLGTMLTARAAKVDRALLAILAVLGLATWPLAGHPTASTLPLLTVVADMAHLAAMSVWIGGLVMLFGFLLRRADARELGAILPVWSGWAMLAVAVLVLAGTAEALMQVVSVDALLHTTYGKLVLVKVGLLAAVVAVAAYSRRLAARADQEATPRRLRRTVLAEVAVLAVVLGVGSALVQTTPARTAVSAASQQEGPFIKTLTSSLYVLDVSIDPARVGTNGVHLFAYTPQPTPQRQPLTVLEWKATAALPSAGIEPIEVTLLPVPPNHAVSEFNLPTKGEWEFRFTLRISETSQETVTVTVPIR
jgi:copper transport protein